MRRGSPKIDQIIMNTLKPYQMFTGQCIASVASYRKLLLHKNNFINHPQKFYDYQQLVFYMFELLKGFDSQLT